MAKGSQHPSVRDKLQGTHNTANGLSTAYVSPLSSPIFVGAPSEKDGVGIALTIAKAAANDVSKDMATSPFRRIKFLIQNQNEMLKTGRLSRPYKGISDCAVRTIRYEGFFSLWRGNTASVIRVFVAPVPRLAFEYYHLKRIFVTDRYRSECYWKWFVGSLAAYSAVCISSGLFCYSLDYAYTRLAADIKASTKCGSHYSSLGFGRCYFTLDSAKKNLVCNDAIVKPAESCGERQFNGLIDVYKKTLKSDGIAGLYRGFSIVCVGQTVYAGLHILAVDYLFSPLVRDGLLQRDHLASTMILVGVTFGPQLAYYPFDTLSSRMMMTSGEAVKYKNCWNALAKIIKNEGAKSLFKGFGASILLLFAFRILSQHAKPFKMKQTNDQKKSKGFLDTSR